jgi:translation initiation factor 4G
MFPPSILNKLTVEKFDSLSDKLINVGITDAEILKGIIYQIFDKAVLESNFCHLYAVLCAKMSERCPVFTDEAGNSQKFLRILLNKCQEEFEVKEPPKMEPKPEALDDEDEESKWRRRVLGNIKFIGELFKQKLLPEKIMHECINSMLKDMQNPREEDVESLCKLMKTVGKDLDQPTAKYRDRMDGYFSRMKELSTNPKLQSRIRFMLRVRFQILFFPSFSFRRF